jgi:hypothetical protein
MIRAGYEVRMRDITNNHKILVGKPQGKKPDRSKGRTQTKCSPLVLQVAVSA